MSDLHNLSVAQLRQVIALKEQIEELQAELDSITGGESAAPAPAGRKKRRMSAAARAAIGRAQKARWAKAKAGKSTDDSAPTGKKKRKVSAAARAKLTASAKARWAKAKAAGKSTL
jgi:uncharacterized small protein (DUF1192 family)